MTTPYRGQVAASIALCRLIHSVAEALDDREAMRYLVTSCRAAADALEARQAIADTEHRDARWTGADGARVAASVHEFMDAILGRLAREQRS